ncbi:Os10g0339182 [Oryza sativa Japonica Group]|uniref:Os10g0339182 protein n=1 Tax=Oryza sativa subsp. japonica TaxID=39947 RepID=A0A0P0XSY3_ORYSJ|nr:hypothetical protein EE612_050753 [Oryza sativa]KAF2913066.1 hypothetical protein DAI22_10g060700 [Oryza sativa Japonica Group]BAT10401.1 Os10g0339182 [Oryza sativa Japonica Group]
MYWAIADQRATEMEKELVGSRAAIHRSIIIWPGRAQADWSRRGSSDVFRSGLQLRGSDSEFRTRICSSSFLFPSLLFDSTRTRPPPALHQPRSTGFLPLYSIHFSGLSPSAMTFLSQSRFTWIYLMSSRS